MSSPSASIASLNRTPPKPATSLPNGLQKQKIGSDEQMRAEGTLYMAVQYRARRLMSVKKRCQPGRTQQCKRCTSATLSAKTTEADAVYYIGLFPSYEHDWPWRSAKGQSAALGDGPLMAQERNLEMSRG
jgi:hypothetical protein